MNDRLKIALRFILLILIGSLIGFSPSANSVTENTQKLRLAFAAEDYSSGAEILVDLAEENPWWTSLWESAGDAAYLGSDYPTAKSAYEKAFQNNDLSVDGQIKLGQTYLELGKQDKAVAGEVVSEHKPMVVVVNKWDLALKALSEGRLESYKNEKDFRDTLSRAAQKGLFFTAGSPFVYVSALTGFAVQTMLRAASWLHKNGAFRLTAMT